MLQPIICAIDTKEISKAIELAEQVRPYVGGIKLGLEFFVSHGPKGVAALQVLRLPIFLDLKLHDIPNTVACAVEAATSAGISMLTVHASGGGAMLKAARTAADAAAKRYNVAPPLLLAVTVLTSLEQEDLTQMGVLRAVPEQVVALANLAKANGMDGVVCAAPEISAVRKACGANFKIIVPGLRPAAAEKNDQKRVMTPQAARMQGADYLVIGRPITSADNPAAAAAEIAASIAL
jgi:orotidine-5'-phosphate decarboxylase